MNVWHCVLNKLSNIHKSQRYIIILRYKDFIKKQYKNKILYTVDNIQALANFEIKTFIKILNKQIYGIQTKMIPHFYIKIKEFKSKKDKNIIYTKLFSLFLIKYIKITIKKTNRDFNNKVKLLSNEIIVIKLKL